eukprot:00379_3
MPHPAQDCLLQESMFSTTHCNSLNVNDSPSSQMRKYLNKVRRKRMLRRDRGCWKGDLCLDKGRRKGPLLQGGRQQRQGLPRDGRGCRKALWKAQHSLQQRRNLGHQRRWRNKHFRSLPAHDGHQRQGRLLGLQVRYPRPSPRWWWFHHQHCFLRCRSWRCHTPDCLHCQQRGCPVNDPTGCHPRPRKDPRECFVPWTTQHRPSSKVPGYSREAQ